ncbi:hypothetical protein B7R54_15340 [Subtercola boreus]|uniref:YdbS-like PH domain-containing protein n=2 Tax=Subtercola boreus TaxID=120213 RepID=A0A3E0VNY1_9MICO|nr:hypothetical protein B7R54_15340 [Subtercola boreus]TQL56051.1 hypothetical protein FB464_3630 [Subtercola boreus]
MTDGAADGVTDGAAEVPGSAAPAGSLGAPISPVTPPAAPTAKSRRLDYDGPWRRVSSKYVGVVVAESIVTGAVLAAISLFFALVIGAWFGWWMLGAAVIVTIVLLVVAPRRARAIGFQLRTDDLLYRQGIMFFRIVAVPYGRMQLIDVNRGPLARALGLSDLKFVTAAASTGVSIPGLPEAEADELRDRLVALAESRRSGL